MATVRFGDFEKSPKRKPPETSLARYDWSKAQRGRYASQFPRTAHAVVIDPAVYEQFGSADAINAALALILKLRTLTDKLRPSCKRTQTGA
jgi:hypothetical protein